MSSSLKWNCCLRPEQIRAAKALLGWTNDDLARQVGASVASIHRFKRPGAEPRPVLAKAIKATFESAGVEFTDRGVRLK